MVECSKYPAQFGIISIPTILNLKYFNHFQVFPGIHINSFAAIHGQLTLGGHHRFQQQVQRSTRYTYIFILYEVIIYG